MFKQRIYKFFYLLRNGRIGYILSKFGCFLRLWFSKNIVLLPPTSLMMEPTNSCNLKCPLCPTGLGTLNRPKRMMKLNEFKIIIDQVKGYIKEIVLWHYGEPFVNKEILPMIEYAVSKKITIITSTNGHFFHSPEYCEQIVQSGLHRMLVAIDGADQATYEQFRRNGNFLKVTQGVKMLVEAKKRLKSKTPYIELQFILMKHNEHQRQEMKRLAQELEADVFIEKEVGIHASDKRMFSMRNQYLPSAVQYRFKEDQDGQAMINAMIPNDCDWPYRYSVINVDGSVVPCALDLNSHHIMGNVFKEDFLAIWKNEKYQHFRRLLRSDRKKIDICSVCPEGAHYKKNDALLRIPSKIADQPAEPLEVF